MPYHSSNEYFAGSYAQKPQKNKDCVVYTDAQAKAARTGVDVGFVSVHSKILEYNEQLLTE